MIAITKRFLLLSPLLVLARKAFAAGDPAQLSPDAVGLVVGKAIDLYFVPAYRGLADATKALATALEAACATPAAGPQSAAKAGFANVLDAWAKVDFLRFGPMAEQSRLERFSFLPDPHGTGARQLRKILAEPDPALLEQGAVAKLSAAVQGLPALESLLFADAGTTETADYRCRLALAIARNLSDIAAAALEGWTKPGGWADLMRHPGGDNVVYRDANEPLIEILKAVVTGLQQVRDQRLLPALGKSFAEAKPARGVFVRSGLTIPYLRASGLAISELVSASDVFSLTPAVAEKLKGETAASIAAYESALDIKASWTDAFKDEADYQRLRAAFDALKALEDIFSFRFAEAAGISSGFNALDGD